MVRSMSCTDREDHRPRLPGIWLTLGTHGWQAHQSAAQLPTVRLENQVMDLQLFDGCVPDLDATATVDPKE